MAKSAIFTASGALNGNITEVYSVQVTKAGDTTATIDVYNNNAASGDKVWSGAGAIYGAFDISDGNGGGRMITTNSLYVNLSGSTVPVVVVSYD